TIFRNNYILSLIETGWLEDAIETAAQANSNDPGNPELLHLLGKARSLIGDMPGAIEVLSRAHALAPQDPTIRFTLGSCLSTWGRQEEALPHLQAAIDGSTTKTSQKLTYIRTLAECGRAGEALERIRSLFPGDPDDQANKAARVLNTLVKNHHLTAAETYARMALDDYPESANIQGSVANLEISRLHLDVASRHLERALSIKPDDPDLVRRCEGLDIARGELRHALEVARDRIARHADTNPTVGNSLLELNYLENQDPELVSEAHRLWGRVMETRAGAPGDRSPYVGDSSRKIRIGYVSPDFKDHSVANFFLPLLSSHDRESFEIHGYYNGTQVDGFTRRIRDRTDHWKQVRNLTDAELVATIREDGIDILVDLAGHTMENRLEVFAYRAAPVQATWLGYPNTTGLTRMDYRLCDWITDPEGQQRFYSETLVRLPSGFLCYLGEETALPVRDNGDSITFGSFNNLAKISDRTLDLWSRVIDETPCSKLLIKAKQLSDPLAREDLFERLRIRGLPRDRIEMLGRIDGKDGHLGLYGQVDIALDTTPYNGTTTTCEALWMGVPVVGLTGDRHAARVGASLLSHAGLTELVAEDEEDFVARAVALAGDRKRLRAYHAELRERLRGSTLCDADGFARQVEAAYREMLRALPEKPGAQVGN
ncbi:MAG: hypothetical protein R3298_11590, partial [Gammaproteobacteria bacterium]|nr:hypothetical protein [Gammaproteobacteria bacterium]